MSGWGLGRGLGRPSVDRAVHRGPAFAEPAAVADGGGEQARSEAEQDEQEQSDADEQFHRTPFCGRRRPAERSVD